MQSRVDDADLIWESTESAIFSPRSKMCIKPACRGNSNVVGKECPPQRKTDDDQSDEHGHPPDQKGDTCASCARNDRWATSGAVCQQKRQGSTRSHRAKAWLDGVGRLSACHRQPPRRRGCLPSYVPRP